MKKLLILPFLLSAWMSQAFSQSLPADYVDPFIGTLNYGATNPGAIAPRGMVSVSPFNVAGGGNKHEKDSDWNSTPYWNDNHFMTGFSHVNLSGVGCPDLGAILLMPTTGELNFDPYTYGSTYSEETAKAGYYSVKLDKYNTTAEMTSTIRSGVSKYHFPKGQANVLLNLGLNLTNIEGGMLKINSSTELEGFKMVGGFCYNDPSTTYPVYFVMELSQPADEYGTWKEFKEITGFEKSFAPYNGDLIQSKFNKMHVAGDSIGAYFTYNLEEATDIEVKVGVSYVSIENARENLKAETADKDFADIRTESKATWNNLLSTIEVEGGTHDDKVKFYTALYHTLIHPNTLNDVNGEYPEVGTGNIGKLEAGKSRYTVFSLWDTYRNLHPLMSLIFPQQQSDMASSMVDMYYENGWLPKWELNSTETFTMVGDPAAVVIADTYLRGIQDFDVDGAYEAIMKSAEAGRDEDSFNPIRPGNEDYLSKGYISTEAESKRHNVWGSVSTTLEYNIADYSTAQLAMELGKKDDYKRFMKQSKSYKNLFDKKMNMIRPKNADGSWYEPFDPLSGANFQHTVGYVEGTAWQYAFMVPHDIRNLAKMTGGNKTFISQLQNIFDNDLFDMANEPDIAYPYFFNIVKGEEWRTQKTVNDLVNEHYTTKPEGLPGNDDTGTMSAWLVYSMMGFYPYCPADMDYAITSPIFDKVTIHLDNKYYSGEKIEITAERDSENSIYIDQLNVNGKAHNSYFIDHSKLVNGAKLEFKLKDSK
ncbi:GH92 family glycosyl hydrolase [Aureibacter tunicatorum]|uniref:Alpha-1,2-mannosidase n=1 Tax=Aureibacter tunicatorum TaxID=866807 RepID=A0AAE3XLB8_9BACT|nr:GH92 family glycosyl hydrolase [Aureibacter tunicatorum]MDR6238610.1 putative alpha-1,2-mannosidase [Aureibacter tunicatorum]BDD05459.1 alpha-1 2-mannosidase [Aureibacter tunicatorum]